MPPIVQLSFDLPETASDHLEQLLAEELAREATDPAFGLTNNQLDAEEFGDAA